MTSKRNKSARALSRREMLAGSAGLSFAFALGAPSLFGESDALAQAAGRLNAYVSIAKDGTITIMSPALEMGQGVNTSLPLIIAEELDADWAKVKVVQAPIECGLQPSDPAAAAGGRKPDHARLLDALPHGGGAGAPRAARCGGGALERAGDGAHHRAEHRRARGVEAPDELRRGRELRQGPGEDARDQAGPAQAGEGVPADRQGRAAPDVVDKSSGKPIYAMDVQVPGMVYATLARAPVRGSGPTSFNRDELKKQPGIIDAVALDNGVGIIGEHRRGGVRRARQAEGRMERSAGLEGRLRSEPARVSRPRARSRAQGRGRPHHRRRQCGDRRRGQGASPREFTCDYVYHAQMEPHVCVASVTPERRRGVDRHAMADQGAVPRRPRPPASRRTR